MPLKTDPVDLLRSSPGGDEIMSEPVQAKNPDRELWRAPPGDYYADSIFVTEGGGIGMNVGGYVIVKPLRDWHALGLSAARGGAPEPEAQHRHGCIRNAECDGAHRCMCGFEWHGGDPWPDYVGVRPVPSGPSDAAVQVVAQALWGKFAKEHNWTLLRQGMFDAYAVDDLRAGGAPAVPSEAPRKLKPSQYPARLMELRRCTSLEGAELDDLWAEIDALVSRSLAPAPSGPWRISLYRRATAPKYGVELEHDGPLMRYIPIGANEAEAEAVRDALNRVARLAVPGEGTT